MYRRSVPGRVSQKCVNKPRILHQLDDRSHKTGRHGSGDSFVGSSFVSERASSGIIARWQQELAMIDEQIGRLALAKGAGASGGAGTNAACLL